MKRSLVCRSLGFLWAACAVVGSASCGANKNHDERNAAAGPVATDCLDQCYPDPTPPPVDCAGAEEGVQFMPATIWDFDSGLASNFYTYTDWSQRVTPSGWEPPVETAERCIGKASTGVLHIKGGPFIDWGGGMGRHLKCLNASRVFGHPKLPAGAPPFSPSSRGCGSADPVTVCEPATDAAHPEAASVCPARDRSVQMSGAVNSEQAIAMGAVKPEEEYLLGMTLDLSEWDGLSFWARRGVNGQGGIRVALGDINTDDDLEYLRYHINPDVKAACQRRKECGCRDRGKPCRNLGTDSAPDYWCAGPDDGPAEAAASLLKRCGQTQCDFMFESLQSGDQQFEGRSCSPFSFRGSITENYCYDPGVDPNPAESTQLCGDHWMAAINLNTEWTFYKVPFVALHQQGWAKKSPYLDLKNAAVVRFMWGTGFIDYYIDDVRVYRDEHRKR